MDGDGGGYRSLQLMILGIARLEDNGRHDWNFRPSAISPFFYHQVSHWMRSFDKKTDAYQEMKKTKKKKSGYLRSQQPAPEIL